MTTQFFSIPLVITMAFVPSFVFADCTQSDEQCCPGYHWNTNLRKCERCTIGYSGPSCNLKCPYPSNGLDCQQFCNCEKSLCNFQYGCIRNDSCADGLFGPVCMEKCPYPTYGKNCQKICKCNIETCNHKEGCQLTVQ